MTNYLRQSLPFTVLASYWRGEGRLWVVFWVYGIGLTVVVRGVTELVFTFLGTLPWVLAWTVVVVTISVWWWVALWRCAFNCRWRGWGYVVRVFVIVAATLLTARLYWAMLALELPGRVENAITFGLLGGIVAAAWIGLKYLAGLVRRRSN